MPYPLAAVRGKIFGAPFSAASVPGLQLWLDATLGLYTDAAMTTPATQDNDVVGAKADQSANSNHLVQATTAKKPLLKLAIVNGRQVVRTDGTDDLLRHGGAVSAAASGALFLVVKTAASVVEANFMASSDEAGANDFLTLRIEEAVGTPYLEWMTREAGTYNTIYGDTEILASTVYLLTIQSDGAAWTMRVNGANQGLTLRHGANNGDWFGDIAGRDNFVIGALKRNDETAHIVADFCEVLLYDGAMTDANRTLVETYLASTWGITLP